MLRRTVPVLLAQDCEDFQYEVIIVLNGSTDTSEDYLQEMAARHPERLRVFKIEGSGSPAAPRNVGIRKAQGEVIVILDDDVEPDKDLAKQHWRFHQQNPHQEFAAVGELDLPQEVLGDPYSVFHEFPYHLLRQREKLHYLDFWTCNVSVKRKFMLQHGMFNERFLYFEDGLCGYQLSLAGMELRFLPEARGKHWHEIRAFDVQAKGRFIGKWLFEFEKLVPEKAAIQERYGILSMGLRTPVLLHRMLNRVGLMALAIPPLSSLLNAYVANPRPRNRLTDLALYTAFRWSMLAGYRAAKSQPSADAAK